MQAAWQAIRNGSWNCLLATRFMPRSSSWAGLPNGSRGWFAKSMRRGTKSDRTATGTCLIYRQSPDEFRADLRRARAALEDAAGAPVVAYRAPSFSITRQSQWALEVLAEEGFQIDSSIFPIHHDRYGIPGANPRIHQIHTPAGSLWEFPPSVVRFAGMTLPIGGGGYLRLYPLWVTCRGLQRINHRQQTPFLVYLHPWEIDPDQPRMAVASRLSRFRHYVNLGRTENKLDSLLSRFQFGPLGEAIAAEQGRHAVV